MQQPRRQAIAALCAPSMPIGMMPLSIPITRSDSAWPRSVSIASFCWPQESHRWGEPGLAFAVTYHRDTRPGESVRRRRRSNLPGISQATGPVGGGDAGESFGSPTGKAATAVKLSGQMTAGEPTTPSGEPCA